ncbi:MAG: hypothetical protein FRX49_06574 [Trebouxia sp. A1-2]|nr:MAG: hypothetical protein FRX49_06574 [Trebouxia sp. A1-2]
MQHHDEDAIIPCYSQALASIPVVLSAASAYGCIALATVQQSDSPKLASELGSTISDLPDQKAGHRHHFDTMVGFDELVEHDQV